MSQSDIDLDSKRLLGTLRKLKDKVDSDNPNFDQPKHDSESRLEITRLFLKWYFGLIAGSFIFAAFYNWIFACINFKTQANIAYLDISDTVSIVTTTLNTGFGFVIGYYFKNKEK